MKSTPMGWTLAFLALLLSPAPYTRAGESSPAAHPWTPEQLIERALASNPELKSYEASWAAARGERTQAGLWKNPEIEAEYGQRRVSSGDETQEGFTRSITLLQTFEFPGKGSLRKAIADRNVEIAQAGLEQFRLSLAGKIRLLALRHQIAVLEAETAEEAAARGEALIEVLQKRPNAGAEQLLELRIIEAAGLELKKQAAEALFSREEIRLELAARGIPTAAHLLF